MNEQIHLGLVQRACGEDTEANLAATISGIHEAADRGANIISTQELFRSRYFCQTEDHNRFQLAETIPGPSTAGLSEVAKARGVVIVASLFERRAPGLFHNTAVVLDADGALLGRYRKMHIPDDPLFYEKFYFTPGDTGFRAWDTRFGRIGVLVCWDQWYPEAARLTALAGAQILFYPTAIGWHPSEKAEHGEAQHASWETMQRSHAIANGVYVAATNRVGFEPTEGTPHPLTPSPPRGEGEPDVHAASLRVGSPVPPLPQGERGLGGEGFPSGIEFWGQSFVCAPNGQVLQRASVNQEEVLVVPIDLGKVEEARTHWPFLRDRRIDAYAGLTRRYLDDEGAV